MVRWRFKLILFIAVFILTCVYFFMFSKSGFLERIGLENNRINILNKIERLKLENTRLQHQLQKYKHGEYPPDDILQCGYIRPGEKIIFFREQGGVPQQGLKRSPDDSRLHAYLPRLRIAWILFSALVVAALVWYSTKKKVDAAP